MRKMLIVSTNALPDREDEVISEQALRDWVESQWKDGRYVGDNPYLFYHDQRLVIGRVIWSDFRDGLLIEIAEEVDTPLARAIWDGIVAREDGASSHGFVPVEQRVEQVGDRQLTVFTKIVKLETSWVAREDAANPFTIARGL